MQLLTINNVSLLQRIEVEGHSAIGQLKADKCDVSCAAAQFGNSYTVC